MSSDESKSNSYASILKADAALIRANLSHCDMAHCAVLSPPPATPRRASLLTVAAPLVPELKVVGVGVADFVASVPRLGFREPVALAQCLPKDSLDDVAVVAADVIDEHLWE